MPKINKNSQEQSTNVLEEMAENAIRGMIPFPMVVCGVNRKVNTGNFENIDVYCGVAVPVTEFPQDDIELFKSAITEAADLGFGIVSKETGDKYTKIKETQSQRGS